MHGNSTQQSGLLSHLALESRAPPNYRLSGIKALLDEVLVTMSRNYDRPYTAEGRLSNPPDSQPGKAICKMPSPALMIMSSTRISTACQRRI